MSLKSLMFPHLASQLLSEKRLLAKRDKVERARLKSGHRHLAEFFHDPSDPYSQLLNLVMSDLRTKYDIQIETHLVSPPSESAAPERAKLRAYAQMDVMRLAKKAGLDFELQSLPAAKNTKDADDRLKKLGHYYGGMIFYAGEWYWGLDRLHYLEARLNQLGLRRNNASETPIYQPPSTPQVQGHKNRHSGVNLHWYVSFRSPYSAITPARIKALAKTYDADLRIRFVLPMVMRGLPVPASKKKYIPLDAAREARTHGINFGRIADPVGKPIEMAYSLLPWARQQGKDFAFTESWMSAVWSQGLNAGSHRGLRLIVERAGLDWQAARAILSHEDWRAEAESNRAEMMDYGIWGVPSFRVGDCVTWGQDRLWVVENALQKLSAT